MYREEFMYVFVPTPNQKKKREKKFTCEIASLLFP